VGALGDTMSKWPVDLREVKVTHLAKKPALLSELHLLFPSHSFAIPFLAPM
jgi:hypothetical protein